MVVTGEMCASFEITVITVAAVFPVVKIHDVGCLLQKSLPVAFTTTICGRTIHFFSATLPVYVILQSLVCCPWFGTHHFLPPLPPVDGAAANEPGDEGVVGWVSFGPDDPPPVL